jgi:SAM-dependent methyltransferase
MRLLKLEPGAAVLDLCCGPGRHSVELARRGFRVTGVDRTSAFIASAHGHAQKQNLDVEFVQADMRTFSRAGAFDAALMMYTSFGYFEDPAENQLVIVNVCRSLRDRGSLIIELMGKEVLARIFSERDWQESDDAFLLQERKVVNDWSWMEGRWILLRGGERHEFQVTHWIYSAAELTALLSDGGFASVDIYGDLEGSPYDQTARRLVAVAHKSASEARPQIDG